MRICAFSLECEVHKSYSLFLPWGEISSVPLCSVDEQHKQSNGKQKNFPQEVKTVNSLQVITGKNRAAPTKVRAAWSIPTKSQHWLSKPITFDHQDYSRSTQNAGRTALILKPIIDGLQFTQVLMDGGSDLNLLYPDTIRRMGIDPTKIRHISTSFKGLTPGQYANCTGYLLLEVVFGSSDNFRREKLIFHITPFKSSH